MPIKSNQTANGVLILSTDTILLSAVAGKSSITFASQHEQTGNEDTIEYFVSPDTSSEAGERCGKLTLAADEDIQPTFLAGLTIPSASFLIAKATTGSRVESNISYTLYTGTSA